MHESTQLYSIDSEKAKNYTKSVPGVANVGGKFLEVGGKILSKSKKKSQRPWRKILRKKRENSKKILEMNLQYKEGKEEEESDPEKFEKIPKR